MKTFVTRLLKSSPKIAILLGLFLYSSCTKDAGPVIVPPVNAPDISFANEILPILTPNCATGGCHDVTTHRANLDLTAGVAWTNLVNVTANNYGPTLRVKPFDTDSSVLYHKIFDTSVYGGPMPQAGVLPTTQQDLIKKWIEQGAQNN